MKKLSILVLVLLGSFVLVSCKGDKTAPLFRDTANGRLGTIEHLQGEEVDLLDGVRALDDTDGEDVTISIKDFGGYEKNKFGEFELTYSAVDKAKNESTVPRTVIVHETLNATIDALVVGDEYIPVDYNNETAFDEIPVTGARFRTLDMVQVMDKEFFIEMGGENGEYPVFPYASIILLNKEGKVKYARFAAGAAMEVHADDSVHHTELPWDMAKLGFANILVDMEEHMSEDGYVVFAPPTMRTDTSQSTPGRIFLGKHFFFSGYLGGGMLKDVKDVTIASVNAKIELEYNIIMKKPAKIETPEIEIKKHVLTWNEIENALSYDVYVDGVKTGESVFGTSLYLVDLELEFTPEGSAGYDVHVVAVSKDMFKWSDSKGSNVLKYKSIPITQIAAPTITVDENNVFTWNKDEGAIAFELEIKIATKTIKLGTTEETTFDASDAVKGFEGSFTFNVKAISGPDNFSDSVFGSKGHYIEPLTKELELDGMTTKVNYVSSENFFLRRNSGKGDNILDNRLYAVTGINEYIKENRANVIFKFGSFVLLDSEGNVKLVRNILANEYIAGKGWINDGDYKGNSDQIIGLEKHLAEGDVIIFGANEKNVTFTQDGVSKTAAARDFIAYHFVNSWDDVTKTPAAGGWRETDLSKFKDLSKVKVVLK